MVKISLVSGRKKQFKRVSVKSRNKRYGLRLAQSLAFNRKQLRSMKVARLRRSKPKALASTTSRALGRPQHPVPSYGSLPLRKKEKYTYSYRSGAVTVSAGSNIYDVLRVNDMFDPDSTGNNLGNKNYFGQAILLNSSYYTQYEVNNFAITYKYTLISDPTIDPSAYTQAFTLGTGTTVMPGTSVALPIEVWETPFYVNVNSEGAAMDTRTELLKTPGAIRHDLTRRGSYAKFTRKGNVKAMLKKLKHAYEDDDVQALYNASPAIMLQQGIYVFNQNAINCSVMCEVEIAVDVTLFNLKPGSVPETYGS